MGILLVGECMNILVFFVAGVSVGWAVDKLYQSFVDHRKFSDDEEFLANDEEGTPKKGMSKTKVKDNARVTKEENLSNDTMEGRDDLSQLKGVGPKLAEALDEIGIYNYRQLSSTSLDELLVRLKETGGRFTMPAISSIVERAKLEVAT